ncbi:MAG: DUF3482 domain-containing protein [Betaproteobacteria bacterium]|nr:DUF3482 domain-containing protein [Betaproteobacteria bacterium]
MNTITLTLVSHTNAGKTTLARTLLRRDVGEVRDAPHVTQENEPFDLLKANDGAVLRLWDTPGFGDSVRLAERLAQSGNPIGWLLTNVWDRLTDRNFWFSQQILRNVRDEADVVLYLVNATEDPVHVGYIAPEMRILTWVGKPVLVLLNQLGPPRDLAHEEAEITRWRDVFAKTPIVKEVLPLDAFARCWVQEDALLACVESLLSGGKQAHFAALRAAWAARNRQAFDDAMRALAVPLVRAAQARTVLEQHGWLASIVQMAMRVGRRGGKTGPEAKAIEALGNAAAVDIRQSTDALLRLHGLDGTATQKILDRLSAQVGITRPIDENQATVIGGAVIGALSGLVGDLAAGGLTLGGAALSGAVAGALAARLAARGINRLRSTEQTSLAWNEAFLTELTRSSMLRYLAVAHFGRGRGEWTESEFPRHWQPVVDAVIAARSDHLRIALAAGRTHGDATPLADWLGEGCREVLAHLYPQP